MHDARCTMHNAQCTMQAARRVAQSPYPMPRRHRRGKEGFAGAVPEWKCCSHDQLADVRRTDGETRTRTILKCRLLVVVVDFGHVRILDSFPFTRPPPLPPSRPWDGVDVGVGVRNGCLFGFHPWESRSA